MSGVFLDYANYYDALYSDKDYQSEIEFIHSQITKFHPNAKKILDIGCGTGRHDLLLAKKGYEITGIDSSEQMIQIAKQKNLSKDCNFSLGDGRVLKLNEKFDVVISLFHVLSYQTSNDDLLNFLETATSHLNDGGICILDYWYGPAVLNIKPEKRTKTFQTNSISITRHANTTIDYISNVASVVFDIDVKDLNNQTYHKMHEIHPMRYLFSPEISLFAKIVGLKELHQAEWMKHDTKPSENSWAAYSVLKK